MDERQIKLYEEPPSSAITKMDNNSQPLRSYQCLNLDWVKDKFGRGDDNETQKSSNVLSNRYFQTPSISWLWPPGDKDKINKDQMTINTDDERKSVSQLEITKTLAGYLQYPISGFNWAREKLSRNENPYDVVPSKEETEIVPYKRPGYLSYLSISWDKYFPNKSDSSSSNETTFNRSKFDEAWEKFKQQDYIEFNKYNFKEYIPDITTVEKTSDVVRTAGEVTGLPQLQWTGTIINKSAKAYKAMTAKDATSADITGEVAKTVGDVAGYSILQDVGKILGSTSSLHKHVTKNKDKQVEVKRNDPVVVQEDFSNDFSKLVQKQQSGEIDFERIKLLYKMSQFNQLQNNSLYRLPNNPPKPYSTTAFYKSKL